MSKAVDIMVEQFKALADPQRLRVMALCRAGELSVSELTEVLGQSQPRVSQHLKGLCAAGLLDRFRDGKRVYYRLSSSPTTLQRKLVALIAAEAESFDDDLGRLRRLRSGNLQDEGGASEIDRAIARALIELTVTQPVGDLLDIGCGRGRVLKMLASRANRAVGVDIDSESRDIARTALFMAGADNCSLRKGDMHQLEFAAESFDTVILDDVLGDAERPADVLAEARRVLRPSGRVVILQDVEGQDAASIADELATLSHDLDLRFAPSRALPPKQPAWLLSVLTRADANRTEPLTAGEASASLTAVH